MKPIKIIDKKMISGNMMDTRCEYSQVVNLSALSLKWLKVRRNGVLLELGVNIVNKDQCKSTVFPDISPFEIGSSLI